MKKLLILAVLLITLSSFASALMLVGGITTESDFMNGGAIDIGVDDIIDPNDPTGPASPIIFSTTDDPLDEV